MSSDCVDSRLARLGDFVSKAEARTAHLLLQAAHREGLLSECLFTASGGQLCWERGESSLEVNGKVFSGGDRLWLDYEAWKLPLRVFLERLRSLSGLSEGQAWEKLCAEAEAGGAVQAAAYAVATQRSTPESYLDFEGWTPEGHNLHPGAKTRDGFSLSEQLAFAPEFASVVALPWISVERSLLNASGSVPEEFQGEDGRWVMPVHPWQLHHQIPRIYRAEWESGAVALVDRVPLVCRPCTSLRTLVPLDERYPVLKTSVGALMTSTERSMSRHTVLQGPIYNEYLLRARSADPDLFGGVKLMEEHGGLCWALEEPASQARNLSLLFRQRPLSVQHGSVAVPCSALPQPESVEGLSRSYFAHFLARGEGVEVNFQRYLDLMIPFHLHLYLRWGIALEAHLQNCVMVWDNTGPRELWVRDWGGLRADSEVVAERAPDLFRKLHPSSVTLRDAEAAEKKLIACLFCNHLTELTYQAARSFELDESELWARVARCVRGALGEETESRLGRRILKEPWPVKCLLRMRLGEGDGGDLYHLRENPLKGF